MLLQTFELKKLEASAFSIAVKQLEALSQNLFFVLIQLHVTSQNIMCPTQTTPRFMATDFYEKLINIL